MVKSSLIILSFLLVSILSCKPTTSSNTSDREPPRVAVDQAVVDVPPAPPAVMPSAVQELDQAAALLSPKLSPVGSQGAIKPAKTGNQDNDDDPRDRPCPCWDETGRLKFGELEGTILTSRDECDSNFSNWAIELGDQIGTTDIAEFAAKFEFGDDDECEMKVGEADSTNFGPSALTCGYEVEIDEDSVIGEDAVLSLTQAGADRCREILCDLVGESPCPEPIFHDGGVC